MGRAVGMFVEELRLRAVGKVSCKSSVGACELSDTEGNERGSLEDC
jgi:hypothetical protein